MAKGNNEAFIGCSHSEVDADEDGLRSIGCDGEAIANAGDEEHICREHALEAYAAGKKVTDLRGRKIAPCFNCDDFTPAGDPKSTCDACEKASREEEAIDHAFDAVRANRLPTCTWFQHVQMLDFAVRISLQAVAA